MYVNCSFSYTSCNGISRKPCLAAAFAIGISVGESGKQWNKYAEELFCYRLAKPDET